MRLPIGIAGLGIHGSRDAGSALNHHVHLHACLTDGVFVPAADQAGCDAPPMFLPARPISQADLAALTERVRRRVIRWFRMHSYERSWMLRGGEPVTKNGTVYMITGGAGGHLETFGPYRPAFQHRVRRGHHFSYVTCFDDTLDIKAFDDEGRLFDHAVLQKPAESR